MADPVSPDAAIDMLSPTAIKLAACALDATTVSATDARRPAPPLLLSTETHGSIMSLKANAVALTTSLGVAPSCVTADESIPPDIASIEIVEPELAALASNKADDNSVLVPGSTHAVSPENIALDVSEDDDTSTCTHTVANLPSDESIERGCPPRFVIAPLNINAPSCSANDSAIIPDAVKTAVAPSIATAASIITAVPEFTAELTSIEVTTSTIADAVTFVATKESADEAVSTLVPTISLFAISTSVAAPISISTTAYTGKALTESALAVASLPASKKDTDDVSISIAAPASATLDAVLKVAQLDSIELAVSVPNGTKLVVTWMRSVADNGSILAPKIGTTPDAISTADT